MAYRERMLLFFGLGILLIGAGWLMLSGWPEAPTPAPIHDAARDLAYGAQGEGEHPIDGEGSTTNIPAVEGEVHTTTPEGEPDGAPDPTPDGEAPAPDTPAQPATPEPTPTVDPLAGEPQSFPLPQEIAPPPLPARDAPIEMMVVREHPEAETEESPQEGEHDGVGETPPPPAE